jgi:hypothetical protein
MPSVLIDTPEIDAARQALLAAATQGNRFDITIATERLLQALVHAALGKSYPEMFVEKTGETSVETAKRLRLAELARREALIAGAEVLAP